MANTLQSRNFDFLQAYDPLLVEYGLRGTRCLLGSQHEPVESATVRGIARWLHWCSRRHGLPEHDIRRSAEVVATAVADTEGRGFSFRRRASVRERGEPRRPTRSECGLAVVSLRPRTCEVVHTASFEKHGVSGQTFPTASQARRCVTRTPGRN